MDPLRRCADCLKNVLAESFLFGIFQGLRQQGVEHRLRKEGRQDEPAGMGEGCRISLVIGIAWVSIPADTVGRGYSAVVVTGYDGKISVIVEGNDIRPLRRTNFFWINHSFTPRVMPCPREGQALV